MLSIAYNGLKIRVRSSIDFVPGPAFIKVCNQTPVKINIKSSWETTRQLWSGCVSVALIFSLRSVKLRFLTFFCSTFLKKYPGTPLCYDTLAQMFTLPETLGKKKKSHGKLWVIIYYFFDHSSVCLTVRLRIYVDGWLFCSHFPDLSLLPLQPSSAAHVTGGGAPRRSTMSQRPIYLLRYHSHCQEKFYPWVVVSLITSFVDMTGTRWLMTWRKATAFAIRV